VGKLAGVAKRRGVASVPAQPLLVHTSREWGQFTRLRPASVRVPLYTQRGGAHAFPFPPIPLRVSPMRARLGRHRFGGSPPRVSLSCPCPLARESVGASLFAYCCRHRARERGVKRGGEARSRSHTCFRLPAPFERKREGGAKTWVRRATFSCPPPPPPPFASPFAHERGYFHHELQLACPLHEKG
jgi:hypothetical protein